MLRPYRSYLRYVRKLVRSDLAFSGENRIFLSGSVLNMFKPVQTRSGRSGLAFGRKGQKPELNRTSPGLLLSVLMAREWIEIFEGSINSDVTRPTTRDMINIKMNCIEKLNTYFVVTTEVKCHKVPGKESRGPMSAVMFYGDGQNILGAIGVDDSGAQCHIGNEVSLTASRHE